MKKVLLSLALCWFVMQGHAQDDLVKKANAAKSTLDSNGYHFQDVINLSTTPIEDQGSSGTCWSYSTNSFLESEMIKAGKKPVPLSKIFTARCSYVDKADSYVRMGGEMAYGDGGEPHDVVNMYAKYGAIPESVYSGLANGATRNNFGDMQSNLKSMLDNTVKSTEKNPAWKAAFAATLDAYLGKVPETFTYNGKSYTPKSFANEVVGLNADDYVEFISQANTPYWQKAMMLASDNWAFQWDWNIPMTDFTAIIDNALKNGYTVAWGTDVSEPYFSWPNGVAYVPANALTLNPKRMTQQDKNNLFDGPKDELSITPELRQAALENGLTSDDHGMHIVGLSKDQNGREYYIIKNSWGETNEYKGFLRVTKAYVQYKTMSILVNKKGIPADIRKKIGV
ncbi:MAG: C1 family peptidase [Chitinophagaceae bacterium]